jgi:hypothetical protein
MRISLLMRAGRACAAATLVLSLGLAPVFAHMAAPFARPGLGPAHFPGFAARGFNRFGFTRLGFNRFGLNRFDRFGFNHFGFGRFGWNGAGWGWNQLGLAGWGYWGDPNSAPSEPIIIGGGGPPLVVNVVAGSGTGGAGDGYAGGCVIHKLIYDVDGKYVGQRQIPQC